MERISRSLRSRITIGAGVLVAAALAMSGPLVATSASAQGYWGVTYSHCPAGKVVQLKFVESSGGTLVGYGLTSSDASTTATPGNHLITLKKGKNSITTGMREMYWQVWTSPGKITSWSEGCVSYVG